MKKSIIKTFFSSFLYFILFQLLFISCQTTNIMPEKLKDFDSDKTSYAEMSTVKLKIGRKKFYQNIIFKLYGTLEDNVLTVNEIYWFDNWENGWTEAKFAAKGQIKITNYKTKVYEVISPVEIEFPVAAKLRIKDSVLINDSALKTFQNRLDRINSAVDLLKDETSAFEREYKFVKYEDFASTIGNWLFPEKYYYSSKFSRYGNLKPGKNNRDSFVFADGTFWNKEYTEAAFPEYMWDVRNTGTLYKDWEENLDLFYFLYNWDFFFGTEAKHGSFKKISWKPEKKSKKRG